MKRKLLTTLIAYLATVGATSSALAKFPTVYGKVNVTLNKYDLKKIEFPNTEATNAARGGSAVDERDNWSLESNGSRIGVRGDFDINSDLKAIYKFEYGVDVDNGTGSNGREFNQRNIYGGLQSSTWGTIFAGKNDTPLKLIQTNTVTQSDIDRFNDLPLGDIENFMVGKNRESNIVMYTTPKLSGFTATLAIMPGEEDGASTASQNDDIADRTSLALSYNAKSLYAGIAADQNVQNTDIIRLVGEITLGQVKVGALYQTAEVNDKDWGPGPVVLAGTGTIRPLPVGDTDFVSAYKEQDAWLLGGEWKIASDWKLKAQYGESESTPVSNGLGDTKLKQAAIGVDYKLNDHSKLLAYYVGIEGEGDSAITNDTIEDKTFAIGYEIKF